MPALVLGGTGPVGQRVVRLLAREGSSVRVGSRQMSRASLVCDEIRAKVPSAQLEAAGTGSSSELAAALDGRRAAQWPDVREATRVGSV